jgi:hypothetical protein
VIASQVEEAMLGRVRVRVCAGHRFRSAANGTDRLPRFLSKLIKSTCHLR